MAELGKIIYGSDKCKVCPLGKVDQCTSSGSVFEQIEKAMTSSTFEILKEEEDMRIKKLESLIDCMIGNLKALIVNQNKTDGT